MWGNSVAGRGNPFANQKNAFAKVGETLAEHRNGVADLDTCIAESGNSVANVNDWRLVYQKAVFPIENASSKGYPNRIQHGSCRQKISY